MRAKAKVVDQKKVSQSLDKLRKLGDAGALLAERLVKWTAEASLAEFKKLTPPQRKLFEGVIAVTLSGPSLELVDPS